MRWPWRRRRPRPVCDFSQFDVEWPPPDFGNPGVSQAVQWPAPAPPAPPGSLLITSRAGRCTANIPGGSDGPRLHWCALDGHPDDAHECRCRIRWGADCLG